MNMIQLLVRITNYLKIFYKVDIINFNIFHCNCILNNIIIVF